MKRLIILSFCAFLAVSCSKVETATNIAPINLEKTPTVSPSVQENVSLKPVKPDVELNAKQRKELDKSLPPKVREILEKAESFEILADRLRKSDSSSVKPNRIAKITNEADKKEVLEAFYFDASREGYSAACFLPHHAIRATYQGKTVEIEICFDCSKFIVESEVGRFYGTIAQEIGKSEDLLNQIIESKGIEIKQ